MVCKDNDARAWCTAGARRGSSRLNAIKAGRATVPPVRFFVASEQRGSRASSANRDALLDSTPACIIEPRGVRLVVANSGMMHQKRFPPN